MYPGIPAESMAGASQLIIYFATVMAVMMGWFTTLKL